MSAVKNAAQQLAAALAMVADGTVYLDPAAPNMQTPALVIGPPVLIFGTQFVDPTEAHFPVWLVVDQSEDATEKLWELAPEVNAAIHEHSGGVVRDPADPFAFPYGDTQLLPSYQFVAEFPLEVSR